jgi:hypothetical protein
MLVRRVPVLCEADAAEFLELSPGTLRNMRSAGYKGKPGPVYSRMKNGRIRYRLDQLELYRDGDQRISTTEAYTAALSTTT